MNGKSPQKGDKLREVLAAIAEVLKAFCLLFPDEESCWSYYERKLRAANRVLCPKCQNTDLVETANFRVKRCQPCKKNIWIFANTSYEGKKKLRARYLAMWLMEHNIELSEHLFSQIADVCQSTGAHISKAILIPMEGLIMEEGFGIGSCHFDIHFVRRSVKTPRDQPPIAEELAQQKEETKDDSLDIFQQLPKPKAAVPENLDLSPVEQSILDLVKTHGTVQANFLASTLSLNTVEILTSLSLLEIMGQLKILPGGNIQIQKQDTPNKPPKQIHYPNHPLRAFKKGGKPSGNFCQSGNCKQCQSKEKSKRLQAVADRFALFVKENHHGFSRKYLQLFLVACTFLKRKKVKDQVQLGKSPQDRSQDTTSSKFFSILDCCLSYGPIKRKDILDYVSPLIVRQRFRW